MASQQELARRPRALPRLEGPVDPTRFVEVTGDRCALFGREDGPFECWIWPLKVLSDLRIGLRRQGAPVQIAERTIAVSPGEFVLTWRAPELQLRIEAFACRERPGMALTFAADCDEHLDLEITFRCDFRPMWPAGLGGQLARTDPVTGAFALQEELGRFAALVGLPEARIVVEESDHALPPGPVRLLADLPPGGSSTVLAIAGVRTDPEPMSRAGARGRRSSEVGFMRGERALADARELWWRLVSDFSSEREAIREHWTSHLTPALEIVTGDATLDEAARWSSVAIERSWVKVEGLGRGLVAGFAPSGVSERPGYAWFFDGDAMAAARALSATGHFDQVREILRFAASHQREDGKLMHELPLSAGLCNWAEDYPYGYFKGLNSADFASVLEHHVALSGDIELARELWPAVTRALDWCARSRDDMGRLSNVGAGVGTVDSGPLAGDIDCEIFLQGAWISSLKAAARIGQQLGHDVGRYRRFEEEARAGFEAFWAETRGHYGFAMLEGGKRHDDLTAYIGLALSRGIGERDRAWASAQALNRPESMSDWGVRLFARAEDADRAHGSGSVYPYLTNFSILALYAHGHAFAAHQVLRSQVALCHLGGLGYLEERFEGELLRVPRQGVCHQVFSSAALLEATLFGLFGLEGDAAEGRVAFRPSLPPDWDSARLNGLRIGGTRLDVHLQRRREAGQTTLLLEVERGEGDALQVGFAPVLPPLTRLLDGPGWLRPSGAVVPRRLKVSPGEPLVLEARVLEGPSIVLPSALPPRGEGSRNPRLIGQHVAEDTLHWTFAGPAGSHCELPFHCDFPVEVTGARLTDTSLVVEFPPGAHATWSEVAVEVRGR
jgi:hypothetical protein